MNKRLAGLAVALAAGLVAAVTLSAWAAPVEVVSDPTRSIEVDASDQIGSAAFSKAGQDAVGTAKQRAASGVSSGLETVGLILGPVPLPNPGPIGPGIIPAPVQRVLDGTSLNPTVTVDSYGQVSVYVGRVNGSEVGLILGPVPLPNPGPIGPGIIPTPPTRKSVG